MRKVALLILFGLLLCGLAIAQETITGNTNYAPTVDVMGAHENGGRGCAGCHAPHSGGRGSGGNIIAGSGTSYTPAGTEEGDTALWGTDTNPIETGMPTINFDSKYSVTISGANWASGKLYTGLVTCLSCHDGNVSKGAMMAGVSYEQAWGLLNFATTAGSNGSVAVSLYGSNPIPTLLGNDQGVAGDYNNDHPVGPLANLGAVFGNTAVIAGNMTVNFSTAGKFSNIVAVANTPFANFVSGYGTPALSSLAQTTGDTAATDLYVVCTTCHNQHLMNVYSVNSHGSVPIANGVGVTEATIFFVNGPYNPGAPYSPKFEPSTMRFCQQCHFSMSSEANGTGTAVGTAF